MDDGNNGDPGDQIRTKAHRNKPNGKPQPGVGHIFAYECGHGLKKYARGEDGADEADQEQSGGGNVIERICLEQDLRPEFQYSRRREYRYGAHVPHVLEVGAPEFEPMDGFLLRQVSALLYRVQGSPFL